MYKAGSQQHGFTIVELLVVIVVIGILAAITVVAYTGISQKAIVATLQSDLGDAAQKLKLYQAEHGGLFPQTFTGNCPTDSADISYCLKPSSGNIFYYTSSSPYSTFGLTETNTNGTAYNVTDSTAVAAGALSDPWANWYSGIAATALAGKYVYKTDLGSTYQYKTSATAVESPQGAIGIDPNSGGWSLVSPQTNPGVDFSAYPAQNACKVIGGRLPNLQEENAIYAGRATYGNNFHADFFWSATTYNSSIAYGVPFGSDPTNVYILTTNKYVRCVSG